MSGTKNQDNDWKESQRPLEQWFCSTVQQDQLVQTSALNWGILRKGTLVKPMLWVGLLTGAGAGYASGLAGGASINIWSVVAGYLGASVGVGVLGGQIEKVMVFNTKRRFERISMSIAQQLYETLSTEQYDKVIQMLEQPKWTSMSTSVEDNLLGSSDHMYDKVVRAIAKELRTYKLQQSMDVQADKEAGVNKVENGRIVSAGVESRGAKRWDELVYKSAQKMLMGKDCLKNKLYKKLGKPYTPYISVERYEKGLYEYINILLQRIGEKIPQLQCNQERAYLEQQVGKIGELQEVETMSVVRKSVEEGAMVKVPSGVGKVKRL